MLTRRSVAFLVVMVIASAARAQDGATVIAAASKAMGVDRLDTVEFAASGYDFALGQAYTPTAAWPRFVDKTYTRAVDFRTPASRVDRVRLQGEHPPRGGGLQPVRGEQTQTQTIVVSASTPWVQQLEIWMLPHGFLRAAAANRATAKRQTIGGKRYTVLTFTGQNKAPVNGYVNDKQIVERVETRIDNAVLGDMAFEAIYTHYTNIAGVMFPMHMVQTQGGYPILDLTVSDVKPNAPVKIAAPPAAPPAAAPSGPASEKIADGVFLIRGAYASLAVDFKDYIVVVEGPQSDDRGAAVIAEAKKVIPNKPIRYVVNTHHHFDHSSGLRAFVAEGATVVTHQVNKPYYEKTFAAPHTLGPDRLAAAPRKATFETFTDRKVLTDGNRVVELYHLQGSGHNEGLIVAYLPKEKLLVEADAFNPLPKPTDPPLVPVSPYTANLVENIQRLKLAVDRIIPIHYPADGRVVKPDELMRAVKPGTTH